jgi:pilus assembly protein CpaE
VALSITLIGTTDRQLEELLSGSGHRVKAVAPQELLALSQPGAAQPDVVVLDVRASAALPPTLSSLRRQHPGTGIVIVARRMDPALMLEAMRAGVSEWLADPITAQDLAHAVARVTSSRPLSVNGQIFAFVGAKGGVGTTTTAINVAAALAQVVPDEQTLLMDMHLSYGDAAVYLGAEPRFSVADAMENTHRLDESFFESLVVQTKSGVHLLASAERATSGADLRRVSTLLQFAMSHYRFTLLDLPRSDASALDALEGVATILIVANQELATVRNAGRMAAALRQRYGKERVRVIVSRYDKQAEIGTEDVARVVGSPVSFNVPSDYRAALQALNKGRPLASDRDTKLAGAFHAIACELAGVKAQPASDDAKGGGLLGLFGRR